MPISPSVKKLIVITAGDPSGIGPEITLKALSELYPFRGFIPLVVGDRKVFRKTAKLLKSAEMSFDFADLENVDMAAFRFGRTDKRFASAAAEYLNTGVSIVLRRPRAALVTAPINKESLHRAGFPFPGHTEYLAHAAKKKDVTMMLVGGKLRVSLVTRHLPLKDAPKAITRKKIIIAAVNTDAALRKFFGIKKPRIGVAGLNPHAGDGGMLGGEEKSKIVPAVKILRKSIPGISGPEPADTLFYKALKGKFDAVLAMYHDQGLIPLKMIAFESGVNVSLGLPFVRTSPDHGTAFDIAGKGVANPSSMLEAIKLAIRAC